MTTETLEQMKADVAEAKEVTVSRDRFGYRIDGEFYRRVTTFLGGIPKPWLANWAAKMVAEFAVEEIETIRSLVENGKATDATKLLKGAPWSKRDDAGDRGTAIHLAAEALARGHEIPDLENEDELDCAIAVEAFLKKRGSKILGTEITVFNPAVGYAGTFDLWEMDTEGMLWLLDWKSSKSVYAEHAVQLAAYRHAEFAVVQRKDAGNGKEEKWTGKVIPWGPDRVDRMGVVHVRPDGATLYPVRYDTRLWTTFRAAAHTKMFSLDTNDYGGKEPRFRVFDDPLMEVTTKETET